jgi:hypothetical protein
MLSKFLSGSRFKSYQGCENLFNVLPLGLKLGWILVVDLLKRFASVSKVARVDANLHPERVLWAGLYGCRVLQYRTDLVVQHKAALMYSACRQLDKLPHSHVAVTIAAQPQLATDSAKRPS